MPRCEAAGGLVARGGSLMLGRSSPFGIVSAALRWAGEARTSAGVAGTEAVVAGGGASA
jgi:hypothetical protein